MRRSVAANSTWSQREKERFLAADRRWIQVSGGFVAVPRPPSAPLCCGWAALDVQLADLLPGVVTEIVGRPGSGRTALCLRFAARNRCLWVDTEGGLVVPDDVSMEWLRIFDHLQLLALTSRIGSLAEGKQLIVIDSIAAAVRALGSDGDGPCMRELGLTLRAIARTAGVAVLVTNHLALHPARGVEPCLRRTWGSIPTHSFEVRRGDGGRVLRVLRSPCLPRGAEFALR